MTNNNKLERIVFDPSAVFVSPDDVLSDPSLTKAEKIAALLQWQYDASEETVALEEGMPGTDTDALRRVLLALGRLTGPIDVEHTGPANHHGLARAHLPPDDKGWWLLPAARYCPSDSRRDWASAQHTARKRRRKRGVDQHDRNHQQLQ